MFNYTSPSLSLKVVSRDYAFSPVSEKEVEQGDSTKNTSSTILSEASSDKEDHLITPSDSPLRSMSSYEDLSILHDDQNNNDNDDGVVFTDEPGEYDTVKEDQASLEMVACENATTDAKHEFQNKEDNFNFTHVENKDNEEVRFDDSDCEFIIWITPKNKH
ncbi:uncharacterized protein L201_003207 [Kwoniella dendrophila CBS 6074]|uniref:Uncharacterized protein n=1 Tax=Kwoniella dendrophila CBS 6074 TaxID=1295534 RepID=A0AAX4JU06_9TREE